MSKIPVIGKEGDLMYLFGSLFRFGIDLCNLRSIPTDHPFQQRVAKKQIHKVSYNPLGNWLLPVAAIVVPVLKVNSLNDPATLPRTALWSALLLIILLVILRKAKGTKLEFPALPKMLLAFMGLSLAAHLISFAVAHDTAEAILATSRLLLIYLSMIAVLWQLKAGGMKALDRSTSATVSDIASDMSVP